MIQSRVVWEERTSPKEFLHQADKREIDMWGPSLLWAELLEFLSCINKQAEQAIGYKSVSRIPPWPLLLFLPPGSCLVFLSSCPSMMGYDRDCRLFVSVLSQQIEANKTSIIRLLFYLILFWGLLFLLSPQSHHIAWKRTSTFLVVIHDLKHIYENHTLSPNGGMMFVVTCGWMGRELLSRKTWNIDKMQENCVSPASPRFCWFLVVWVIYPDKARFLLWDHRHWPGGQWE